VPPDPSAEPAPPLPPADLARRPLPIEEMPAGTLWWRIHQQKHDPLFFGPLPGQPPQHRFDAPDGSFRVCYLGTSEDASFAESFFRGPGLILEEGDLELRAFSQIQNTHSLRLVQMHGPGLARLGGTAAVASGPYGVSQQWALALHNHADRPDGILYRARHDDDLFCAAVFDGPHSVLMLRCTNGVLEDRPRVNRLLARYGAIVVSTKI
jgi:hypothetical protein